MILIVSLKNHLRFFFHETKKHKGGREYEKIVFRFPLVLFTVVSFNLYAYCNNNPVMYSDPEGHMAIMSLIILALGIGLGVAATANDIYQIAADNLTIIPSESGKTFQLNNSYRIVTPWVQWGYSFYLNHFNAGTKDIIQGTTRGTQLEWMWHNLAYYGLETTRAVTDWLGWEVVSEKMSGPSRSAVNADFGFNVFADNPGIPGIAMAILNFFTAPWPTITDGILYLTKYGRR